MAQAKPTPPETPWAKLSAAIAESDARTHFAGPVPTEAIMVGGAMLNQVIGSPPLEQPKPRK
jgi:hypothetical protein